jgi:hypothetical protein
MFNIYNILKILHKRGFRFCWDFFIESICFDLRYGVSTAFRVTKDRQTLISDHVEQVNGVLYVASFTTVIEKTLNIAQEILGPDRVKKAQFMDLGCGKGKALIIYTRIYGGDLEYMPVGIEYDPVLAGIARLNVCSVPFAKGRVDIFTDSATNLRKYLISNLAIIYLYNPFKGQTFIETLSALQGIPHLLIYVDPVERELLIDFDYFIYAENKGRYNSDHWIIARSFDL